MRAEASENHTNRGPSLWFERFRSSESWAYFNPLNSYEWEG